MTYYHASKAAAQAVADEVWLEEGVAIVRVEFVPNNGWVVVAIPMVLDIKRLGDVCEVRHPAGYRLTEPPATRRPIAQKAPRTAPPPPPPPAPPPVAPPVRPVLQPPVQAPAPPPPPAAPQD